MNQAVDKEIIEKYLLKICEDRDFEKSPRSVRLLKFLSQKALEKTDVTEYIVGLELFEQSYKPEANDSKVRVYMYNLRKKLDEYYRQNGAGDELKFVLKKGQYNLGFEWHANDAAKNKRPRKQKYSKLKFSWFNGIAVTVIIALGLILIFQQKNKGYHSNDCWKPFFAKSAQNICVMADQLMVYQYSKNEKIPRIIFGVNSENDFIEYIKSHRSDTLQLADYTLFSKMAPYSVKRLTEWYGRYHSTYSLRLESNFSTDELRDNNLLYIGQFKTMHASKALFLKGSKKFSIEPNVNGFIVHSKKEDKKVVAHTTHDLRVEYAMVSFMPLEGGKFALFFVSNNDIGVMATINNFTNKSWLNKFYQQLPTGTRYFNALFEVSGIGRTEMDCRLMELEALSPGASDSEPKL